MFQALNINNSTNLNSFAAHGQNIKQSTSKINKFSRSEIEEI